MKPLLWSFLLWLSFVILLLGGAWLWGVAPVEASLTKISSKRRPANAGIRSKMAARSSVRGMSSPVIGT